MIAKQVRWRHPLVLPSIAALVVAVLAVWVLWLGNHEGDPSYGATLLQGGGEGGLACFVMAFIAFELSFVTLPFPVPTRFRPPYLRLLSAIMVAAGIWVGGQTLWDLLSGPAHARGTVSQVYTVAPTRSYGSTEYHIRVAGNDFGGLSEDQYRGATIGTCVRITYGRHSETVTDLRTCAGASVAVSAPAALTSSISGVDYVGAISAGAVPGTILISSTANAASSHVYIVSATTGSVLKAIAFSVAPHGLAVDPVRHRIFVGRDDISALAVLDGITGQQLKTLAIRLSAPNMVYDPVNGHLATVSTGAVDEALTVVDTGSAHILRNTTIALLDMRGTGMVVAAHGRRFFLADNHGGMAYDFDAASGAMVRKTPLRGTALDLAADDANGQVFLVDSDNNQVVVFDALTGAIRRMIPVGANPWGLALDPVEGQVYVANSDDGTLSVIDVRTDAVVRTIRIADRASQVAVDPARHRIFVAGGGSVLGGDSSNPTIITVLDAHTFHILRRTQGTDALPATMVVDQQTGNLFLYDDLNGVARMLNVARLGS